MATKGDLLPILKTVNGFTVSLGWYAVLPDSKYLVIIPSIFKKDPVKFRYAIISEGKFKSL